MLRRTVYAYDACGETSETRVEYRGEFYTSPTNGGRNPSRSESAAIKHYETRRIVPVFSSIGRLKLSFPGKPRQTYPADINDRIYIHTHTYRFYRK